MNAPDNIIERLRGQLQNCINHLDRVKRKYHYDNSIQAAIESANKCLYETLDHDDIYEAVIAELDQLKALDLQNRQAAWEEGRQSMAKEFTAVFEDRNELLNGSLVPMPANAKHAKAMQQIGYAYLAEHAPECLTDIAKERDELRKEVEQLRARLDDLVSAAKNQMCAQGNEAECWDGLHSCCKPELRDAIMRIKPPASAENKK